MGDAPAALAAPATAAARAACRSRSLSADSAPMKPRESAESEPTKFLAERFNRRKRPLCIIAWAPVAGAVPCWFC